MTTKKIDHFGSMHIGQVFVLNENCLRHFVGEIDCFQHLIVKAFSIDMKKVHVSNSMLFENIRQRTYFDNALANEWRHHPVYVFYDVVPAE